MTQTNEARVDLHVATATVKGKTFRTEVWNAAYGLGSHNHHWITYVDGERWNGCDGALPGKADYATARRHQKDDIANYDF